VDCEFCGSSQPVSCIHQIRVVICSAPKGGNYFKMMMFKMKNKGENGVAAIDKEDGEHRGVRTHLIFTGKRDADGDASGGPIGTTTVSTNAGLQYLGSPRTVHPVASHSNHPFGHSQLPRPAHEVMRKISRTEEQAKGGNKQVVVFTLFSKKKIFRSQFRPNYYLSPIANQPNLEFIHSSLAWFSLLLSLHAPSELNSITFTLRTTTIYVCFCVCFFLLSSATMLLNNHPVL